MFAKRENLFFKCLFYYFKVFGVAAMRLDITSPTTNAKTRSCFFSPSRCGTAYNIVLCVFLAVTNCAWILYTYTSDFSSRVKYEKEIDCIEYILTAFTAVLLVATFCVKRNEIIAIANQISSIRESLPISSDDRKAISMYIVKVFLVDFILLIMLNFTTSLFESIEFAVYNLSYSSNYVLNAMMLQYSIVLKVIQHLFRSINDSLRNIAKESDSVNVLNGVNSKITAQKLVCLHKLYASSVGVSQEVSSLYSLPMLSCSLSIFISTTIAFYYLAKPIVLGKSHNLTFMIFVHCFLYAFVYVFLLVTLTRSATATVNESKRTKEFVNACLINADDKNIAKRLKQLSNYLQQTDVKFSVFDLFSLDEALLTSITGTITTYLVIILQFQQSNSSSTS